MDGRDRGGRDSRAKYLVLGTGVLNAAQVPSFPGLEELGGTWYHTADWPKEGVDLGGKRVGVIGTGSSATQLIPIVAEQASELLVFQRTANFVMPARNTATTTEEDQAWKANYAERRQRALELLLRPQPAAGDSCWTRPLRRRARRGVRTPVGARWPLHDPRLHRPPHRPGRQRPRWGLRPGQDPRDRRGSEEGRAPLPRDLPFATKRLCSGINYYETFNRDNVDIVDVKAIRSSRSPRTACGPRAGRSRRRPDPGHRFRCDDRLVPTHRHPRTRRPVAA